jgi:DNA polymerase-1
MNRGSARGYITTWGGRKLRFESVGNTRKKYLGTFKALNKVCQGSSADLIKEAMIAVDQAIDWDTTKLHLTVHDELDLSIPRGDAGKKVMGRIKDAMETFDVTVPILAEFKVGENWGHGKDPEEFFK